MKKIILILAFFSCLSSETYAASGRHVEIPLASQEAKNVLAKIESYLNKITTMKADFIQTTSTGAYNEGKFYLSRPGKMRIDYKPPMKVEIVADGNLFVYHDKELEQVTYLDLAASPAGILLKDKISFNDPSFKISYIRRSADTFEVNVIPNSTETTEIALIFTNSPFQLKQWRVFDAHQITTMVSLYDEVTGIAFEPDLFRFTNPKREKLLNRLTQ